jgi:hypothetical protein
MMLHGIFRFSLLRTRLLPQDTSSVAGPEDGIELPFNDCRVDHEIKLVFVIDENVWDAVLSCPILT